MKKVTRQGGWSKYARGTHHVKSTRRSRQTAGGGLRIDRNLPCVRATVKTGFGCSTPSRKQQGCTLLHVNDLIVRLMQCHIEFLMLWRRESKVREKCRCFARQSPHKLNFRTMRQLDHHSSLYEF